MSVSATFNGCSSLEYVENMEYLETIGSYSFYNTYLLKMEINLPNLKGAIDSAAFYNSGITKIHSLGNITKINGTGRGSACFGNCTNLGFVSLPESLVTLGADAFYNCTSLFVNNFNLPNLTTLGAESFYNCTSLEIEDLSLPNLESLGQNAFYGVNIKKISNLGKITAFPTASSSTQNFGKKDVLEEVVLPDTLTSIQESSFYGYSKLKAINLDYIETIGGYVFREALNGVEIRMSKLQSITGNQVFYKCGAVLLDFTGSTFTETKDSFAQGSTRLEKIVLPSTLTTIGYYAFNGCTSLNEVIVHAATPPTMSGNIFASTNSTFAIYVPDASVTAYKEASGWADYADRIKPISEMN